jgi:hypothetical protein
MVGSGKQVRISFLMGRGLGTERVWVSLTVPIGTMLLEEANEYRLWNKRIPVGNAYNVRAMRGVRSDIL